MPVNGLSRVKDSARDVPHNRCVIALRLFPARTATVRLRGIWVRDGVEGWKESVGFMNLY